MISEHRLSALVGQIRGVEYQLGSKRELAGEMAANADEYGEQALLPAASVLEAAESTDTAVMISHFNDSEQQRLSEEIASLEEEKAGLLWQLYEEDMQTGRWIGVGNRYVQLSGPDKSSNEDSGAELRLHDIPKGHDHYILTDEDPEITARRVEYAADYNTARRQLAGIIGLMFSVFFLASYTPVSAWLGLIGVLAVAFVSAAVFRQGSGMALRMLGTFEWPNSPWLEVMPDNGKRFERSKGSLSGEDSAEDEPHERSTPSVDRRPIKADEHRRGYAYAEIAAERARIEAVRRAKEKKGSSKK